MRFFSVFGCVISFSANAMDYSGPRECAKNAAYLAALLERKPVNAQDLLARAQELNTSRMLPCYQERCAGIFAPWCAMQYYTTKRRVEMLSDDAIVALGGGVVNWAMKECEKVDE